MKPQRISSSPRLYKCPGSAAACAALDLPVSPDAEKRQTAATSGRIVHAAIASLTAGGSIENMALTSREEYVANWFSSSVAREEAKPGRPATTILPEQEVYIGEQWCGHWDRAVVFGEWGSILWEYKTGQAHQEEASSHVQGRLYAVAGVETLALPTPIILYRLSAGEEIGEYLSMCVFEEADIAQARKEAAIIWERASDPKAQRIPGQAQCKYCPARGTPMCPETFQMVEQAYRSLRAEIEKAPEKLSEALGMWKDVQPFGKNLEETCRSAMEAGMILPGWTFGTPKAPRTVPDVAEGFRRLQGIMAQPDYLACCDVSVPAIEKTLYERQTPAPGEKKTTRKAMAEYVNETLGDAMQRIPERPPLVRDRGGDATPA